MSRGARVVLRLAAVASGLGGSGCAPDAAGSGGSFGASSLQPEIGLGDATAIREIEIRWPGSGLVERLEGPPLEAVYHLREGSGRLVPVPSTPTPLRAPDR